MGQNRHFPAMSQNTKRQLVHYANYNLGYKQPLSPNTANHPVCVGGPNIPKMNQTQRKVENSDKSPYVIDRSTRACFHVLKEEMSDYYHDTIQYNIRLLEAVRTQRRTIIEREKYVENENVKMVHNE